MSAFQSKQMNTISVNELLPPTLKVLHFGRLSKKSCDSQSSAPQFHARWCVLTYGIFCYYRTCDKAKSFLESLPSSKSNLDNQLTKDGHRVKKTNIILFCLFD